MDDDYHDVMAETNSKQGLPEIIHVFTKRDRMGFEGYKRQLEVIEGLRGEGVIDKFFFVSSISQFGLNELRQYVLSLDHSVLPGDTTPGF